MDWEYAGQAGPMMVVMLLLTILLVVGNTMAQAVRERTSELAVLKTLGFSDGKVLSLVLVTSVIGSALFLWLPKDGRFEKVG